MRWLLCFPSVCCLCPVSHGLFALPLGVNGRPLRGGVVVVVLGGVGRYSMSSVDYDL